MTELENVNPLIFKKSDARSYKKADYDENVVDPFDEREIFGKKLSRIENFTRIAFPPLILDLIRNINDPEHPLTLEELHVLEEGLITVNNETSEVLIKFTPTIPHCSMASLIGLSIHVKLLRALPPRFKVSVEITPGTHASEHSINKQLNDKERVAASLENSHLMSVINECISSSK